MECYQCLRHGERGTYSGIHWYCMKCFNRYIVRIPNMKDEQAHTAEPLQVHVFAQETDPTGRSPHNPGAKLDGGKPPVFRGLIDYFPRAIGAVSAVSAVGAAKYAWKGWESVPEGFERYSDAMMRHLVAESFELVDGDTGSLHAAQVAWNALARLELLMRDQETGAFNNPEQV